MVWGYTIGPVFIRQRQAGQGVAEEARYSFEIKLAILEAG